MKWLDRGLRLHNTGEWDAGETGWTWESGTDLKGWGGGALPGSTKGRLLKALAMGREDSECWLQRKSQLLEE